MKIADLPSEVKPREKALRHGVQSLNDDELLALLIGSGVKGKSVLEIAHSLTETYLSLPMLATAKLDELESQFGLSKIRSLHLLAVFEFHHRLNSPLYNSETIIQNTSDIYRRYHYLEMLEQEVLIIVMLDRKKRIIREIKKYQGTSTNFSINLKEIIRELISHNSDSFYLIHNHPDEASKPSRNDIISTLAIARKSEELEVRLIDHIIIYKNGYYSFIENHLLPTSNIYKM